jgi:CysZ protein
MSRRFDLEFMDGALAIGRAARFVWRTPAARRLAAVPVLVCASLCVLAVVASVRFVPQLMAAAWPGLAAALGAIGTGLMQFVGVVLASLLGMLLATFATPPLSAPALERLVLLRERALGVPVRAPASFCREFRCALQAQLLALAVFGPLLALLLLVSLLFPPLAVATIPAKFVVVACLLAWSLLDYPLSLRGIAPRARLRLMRDGVARVLGFGIGLALIFMVPFLSLLMLPLAVTAAAEIAAQLERQAR